MIPAMSASGAWIPFLQEPDIQYMQKPDKVKGNGIASDGYGFDILGREFSLSWIIQSKPLGASPAGDQALSPCPEPPCVSARRAGDDPSRARREIRKHRTKTDSGYRFAPGTPQGFVAHALPPAPRSLRDRRPCPAPASRLPDFVRQGRIKREHGVSPA